MILRTFALALLLASPALSHAGVILSEEVSVGERDPMVREHRQEYLIDSMDVRELSPSARFLAMPRPMITPELARALNSGRVNTPDAEWKRIIHRAAKAHGLPENLIASVIRTESDFQAHAQSSKGAQGAMQIMPGTQQELGLTDPYDAEANVMAGCAYLRRQLDRFGSLELALAAYNAGPANVVKYGGIPPFPETRGYISRVTSGLTAQQAGNRDSAHE
ncbi:MAG: lytic transglycosylase domain-containing protein [Mailhella sp.]|nr:lytic transglycosylase domain-containing protein [Mailhella sp.]